MQPEDRVDEHTGEAAEARRTDGGLMLSAEQLDAMLGEVHRSASATQPTRGKSSPAMAIDDLAKVVTDSGAGQPGKMTLPLKDLTQMLRKAQSEAFRMPKRPAAHGSNGVPLGLPNAKQLGTPLGTGVQLDVNFLANLARWVGFHKRILGAQLLRTLVDIYAMTGHLSPTVTSLLVRVEAFAFLPDESDHHEVSDDHLAIALLSLHGIVYGAGVLPAEPPDPFAVARALRWSVPVEDADKKNGDFVASGEREPEHAASSQTTLPRDYERALSALRKAFAGPASGEGAAVLLDPEAGAGNGAVGTEASEAKAVPQESSHPSDLTNDEWERIRPLVPVTKAGGRPGKYGKREIVNAILYHLKTDCPWRGLPADLPPWKIAHHYYRTWTGEGVWGPIGEALGVTETAAETRGDRASGASPEQPVEAGTS